MNAMKAINEQMSEARNKVKRMLLILEQLEREANKLYEKQLNMMMKGHSDYIIDLFISQEWERIITQTFNLHREDTI